MLGRLLDLRFAAVARVPSLTYGLQVPIQHLGSYLEQQVSAAWRPAHLLFLNEALGEQLIDGGLHESGRYPFAASIPRAIIHNAARVIGHVRAELVECASQLLQRDRRGSAGIATRLAGLLSDCREADEQWKVEVGEKTAPWGISVSSVEIRDVAIPVELQNAMSRQAQADREKQARLILGSAEAAIAGTFVATALPCRVITISSPASARSIR